MPTARGRTGLMRGIVFAGLLVYAMGQTILFALMGPAVRAIHQAVCQQSRETSG